MSRRRRPRDRRSRPGRGAPRAAAGPLSASTPPAGPARGGGSSCRRASARGDLTAPSHPPRTITVVHALPPLPTAIAFRSASDGLLGTDRTIELTADGGRTWRVVFRTPRPVAWLGYDPSGRPSAILDDGENLGGPRWRPELVLDQPFSPCNGVHAVFSDDWVL